jgi:hypothetical protein
MKMKRPIKKDKRWWSVAENNKGTTVSKFDNHGFILELENYITHLESQVNNVVSDDVSNRRELLIDFIEWYSENSTADFESDESLADWFLKVKDN